MSVLLETLWLRAFTSGWRRDWDAYYTAEENERQARLSALERRRR